MKSISSPFGAYTLQRLPVRKKLKNDSLRAWDAADELLLNHVNEHGLLASGQSTLLVNDQFGALSVSLIKNCSIQNWSDSYQSHLAAQHNLKLNQLADTICYLPSTQMPSDSCDVVVIKIPKTLALLEDQLIKLRTCITKDTTIIAAGMVKHIHTSTLKLFEKIIGTTKTSLATKKARLVFAKFETDNKDVDKKDSASVYYKKTYPKIFYDLTWDIHLSNHANVFGKDKLDIGARFMLEQLKKAPESQHILDLGCGNGVLGIIAQRLQSNSKLTFVDESYMAIDSARTNYQTACEDKHAEFLVSDGFSKFDTLQDERRKGSKGENVDKDGIRGKEANNNKTNFDLILCNPPFHQQHAIGDHIAWELFKQSREYLCVNGEFWVVGNRHLNYHIKMKRLFGNCKNIAGNKKFVVLASKKLVE